MVVPRVHAETGARTRVSVWGQNCLGGGERSSEWSSMRTILQGSKLPKCGQANVTFPDTFNQQHFFCASHTDCQERIGRMHHAGKYDKADGTSQIAKPRDCHSHASCFKLASHTAEEPGKIESHEDKR